MGTEDENDLTLSARATAAAGAALVAACIVNPLDVIKTRIQAQAMAESAGQRGCATPWTCTSTLYEHTTQHSLHHTHGLSDCHHHQHSGNPVAARPWLHLRHTHTLSPEAAGWLAGSSSGSSSSTISRLAAGTGSSSRSAAAAAAAAAISAARSAAADKAAAAAAAFRRWGITEGPLPIRRTPPYPVPYGWTPAPVTAAVTSAVAAAGAGVMPATTAAAAAAAGGVPCQCAPNTSAFPTSTSMWEMAKSIRAREGLPVLWRGTWASLLIAVPMVGIYMPLYDTLLDRWSSKMGSLAPVVSGTAARMAACFCVAPFELLRTRIQASSAAGVSMRSTLTSLVTEHQHQQLPQQQSQRVQPAAAGQLQRVQQPQGQIRPATVLRAVPRMWTGFSATLVRDVPFSALYWALVEPLRQAMLPVNSHWPPLQHLADRIHKPPQQHSSSSSNSSSGAGNASLAALPPSQQRVLHHSQLEILIANMVSGFVAGGLAAGATTPFDVVKTRMQIASPSQQQQQQQLSGGGGSGRLRVFTILQEVYHKEGFEGMFSGLKPRAARAAPACAIVISVYELLKSYISQHHAL